MPFTYLGVVHEQLSEWHIVLHQQPYLDKLKAAVSDREIGKCSDGEPLTPSEHKEFRSLLCSLLWICQTRLDLAHDVVALQSEMVTPKVEHFCATNSLRKRAVQNARYNGLHFAHFGWPIRIVSIADCVHATSKSCYPFEGKFVFIMADRMSHGYGAEWLSAGESRWIFEGRAHPLYFSARKATRVSHSTSHAETLSAVGCTQTAHLISQRILEIFASTLLCTAKDTPSSLLTLQAKNLAMLPLDHVTDCMDFFELVTNMKGLSSDKSQRVAIMAIREDRMAGRIRYIQHWPTKAMVAGGLTKAGLFPQLMRLATSGYIRLPLAPDQWIRLRSRAPTSDYSEKDLENLDS